MVTKKTTVKTKKKEDLIKDIRELKKNLRENRFRSKADEKNTKLRRETRKKIARIATVIKVNSMNK